MTSYDGFHVIGTDRRDELLWLTPAYSEEQPSSKEIHYALSNILCFNDTVLLYSRGCSVSWGIKLLRLSQVTIHHNHLLACLIIIVIIFINWLNCKQYLLSIHQITNCIHIQIYLLLLLLAYFAIAHNARRVKRERESANWWNECLKPPPLGASLVNISTQEIVSSLEAWLSPSSSSF